MRKEPDPVDVYVGGKVRTRRKMLGISQTKLGQEIGVTFQQLQKYEKGQNRIGSSRLFQLSVILDVPVQWFFDNCPGHPAANDDPQAQVVALVKELHRLVVEDAA